MRLLTTYKLTSRVSTTKVGEWITENNMWQKPTEFYRIKDAPCSNGC